MRRHSGKVLPKKVSQSSLERKNTFVSAFWQYLFNQSPQKPGSRIKSSLNVPERLSELVLDRGEVFISLKWYRIDLVVVVLRS